MLCAFAAVEQDPQPAPKSRNLMFFDFKLESKNPEEEFEGDLSVAVRPSDPIIKKPSLYRIRLLNDDYTPMEFVVYVLQKFFNYDQERATQIMLAVHTHGKGVCGIFTKEIAETKSSQINDFAQQNEHPLISEIEPVDDED